MKWALVCVVLLAVGSNAGAVPPFTPCLWSDSDCILSTAKKVLPFFIEGIKELDIPPVDPVFIKEAVSDTGDLKLKIEDLKAVGISKAQLVKIERDNAKSTVTIVADSPIIITGTYTVGGKLLFVDIEGHGDTELKTDKVRITIEIKLKKIDKNGKSYYTIDGYNFTYDVIDEFFFKFDNLFNGDKTKAEPILTIIRQNWKALIVEVGRPIIEKIVDQEISGIQKFIEAVPTDEIELPA